jgi:hypothetical protein
VLSALTPAMAGSEGPVCEKVSTGMRDRPPRGKVFKTGVRTQFEDTNPHDHVPDGWGGSANYGVNDCDRRIVDDPDAEHGTNVLHQEIFTTSDSDKRSGDVSIYRTYRARRTDRYRVTVRVDLRGVSGDFRGRLKVAPWNGNDAFTNDEKFIDICSPDSDRNNGECVVEDNDQFQVLSFVARDFPRGTDNIRIAWRARETRDEDAAGVAVLDWIKYERIN